MENNRITYSSPGRCGIVGNPSDMYGGSVISCSTAERAFISVEDHDILEICVEGASRPCITHDDLVQDGGMFDAVLAAIEFFNLGEAKIRISVTSDIPVSAGLSGSTAVMTALTAALLEWMEANDWSTPDAIWRGIDRKNPYILAETVRHIELYFLKIVCGYQDAYMCTFGSLNFLDFRDKQNYLALNREPLGTVENLGPKLVQLPIVLLHTGIKRVSGAVHKPIRDRWIEGDSLVVKGVLRLGHIARMTKQYILAGDWDRVGEAMTENHEIVRSFGSSSEANEQLIQAALDAGAIAAKLAGAGKGGTVIALHPDPESMESALRDSGAARFMYPKPYDGVRREQNRD